MSVFRGRKIKHARKDRICYWCGEVIQSGSSYSSWRWRWNHMPAAVTVSLHPECADAWDNAKYHTDDGEYLKEPGIHERGEYDCPNAVFGDIDCNLCGDTPFRRLKRGENKPALVAARKQAKEFELTMGYGMGVKGFKKRVRVPDEMEGIDQVAVEAVLKDIPMPVEPRQFISTPPNKHEPRFFHTFQSKTGPISS